MDMGLIALVFFALKWMQYPRAAPPRQADTCDTSVEQEIVSDVSPPGATAEATPTQRGVGGHQAVDA